MNKENLLRAFLSSAGILIVVFASMELTKIIGDRAVKTIALMMFGFFMAIHFSKNNKKE